MWQTMEEVTKELSRESLTGCGFKVGDQVTFTNNGRGGKVKGLRIIGFGLVEYKGGGSVYLNFECYWFPVRPESLKLEKKAELVPHKN